MALAPLFRAVSFGEIPGWAQDDHRAALAAFRQSALHALETPYRTGSLGVETATFHDAFLEAVSTDPSVSDAQAFFERHFRPFLICPDGETTGFVTGFYEPEVEASAVRDARFTVPLLGIPDDLVKVDDENRPGGLDPSFAFGRDTPDGIVEYFDRAAIENGAVGPRAKPLAWLADKVDAFFIHVQGAARLHFSDGTVTRVTYAAKSGHPFTGPGRVLAAMGEIPLDEVTMQSIRAWFRRNPGRIDEILHLNRSYIFFREAPVENPALGPVAAAKVSLTPGRSLAVDRLLHSFATPFFIDAPKLDAFDSAPFRRLMIAQDTGSAIVGPARGDLFAGSGDAAGEIAGVVRHPARFFALLPCGLMQAGIAQAGAV
jgi:membrane-bound lytic murein transglycosylase A